MALPPTGETAQSVELALACFTSSLLFVIDTGLCEIHNRAAAAGHLAPEDDLLLRSLLAAFHPDTCPLPAFGPAYELVCARLRTFAGAWTRLLQ